MNKKIEISKLKNEILQINLDLIKLEDDVYRKSQVIHYHFCSVVLMEDTTINNWKKTVTKLGGYFTTDPYYHRDDTYAFYISRKKINRTLLQKKKRLLTKKLELENKIEEIKLVFK